MRHTEYILMNRDEPVLAFDVMRDRYEEPVFTETKRYSAIMPHGFRSLEGFLESRRAPKHRAHIAELLAQYGCDDLEGFIRVTHALSLNDTIWVKEKNSPVCWADVSLYSNDFDEVISNTAFDGGVSSISFSATSPEFATDGSFAKCWRRENGEISLYKRGSSLYQIEPVSEFLASQLAGEICIKAVAYEPVMYHGSLSSRCRLFTDEETGFVSMQRLHGGRPSLKDVVERYGADSLMRDCLNRMCVLDALIMNPDRHGGNFGFIMHNSNFEISGAAPVFDNNMALFPQLDDDEIMRLSDFAPRCLPKLGADFNITAHEMLTDDIRRDLCKLKDFRFRQDGNIKVSDVRLEALNKLLQVQIDGILNRTPVRELAAQGRYNL